MLALFVAVTSFGQGKSTRGPCVTGIQYVCFFSGHTFFPKTPKYNVPTPEGCKEKSKEIRLNGLEVSFHQLYDLRIKTWELENDSTSFFSRLDGSISSKEGKGYYTYVYEGDSTCPSQVIYTLDTKIDLYLNGKKIERESQWDVFHSIEPCSFTVTRQYAFWGPGAIFIEMNE